jgi:diguanylate cyclase
MLPQTKTHAEKAQESLQKATQFARLAFPLMIQHQVEPTPQNYAVWYHYVSAYNKDLVKEIDQMIEQGLHFTTDISLHLYNKYIATMHERRLVEETTANAQSLLAHVLEIISGFSSETNEYNKSLDENVKKISETLPQQPMQEMVRELINRVKSIRESGTKMEVKLKESSREIEVLKKDLDKAARESRHDALTGVANRRTFDEFLDEQVKIANKNKSDLCLLMIDIDHFKTFNDKFGHLIGDEVLKTVAKSLIDSVRGKDLVARYGGEEFSVILPLTPFQGALVVAEALRKSIAMSDLKRKDTGATIGSITVSIGLARFRPDADTCASFIARADEALYRSKKNGRNRVTPENG